jgi:hypothetical protein
VENKNDKSSLAAIAALRAEKSGIFDPKAIKDVKVNPEVSAKIAQAFEAMQNNPDDPKVIKAYSALKNEIGQQYEDMLASGMKVSKMKEGMENPYSNSKALVKDVAENKHLWYYPTEQGFGSAEKVTKHPMLEVSKYLDNEGKPMLANDVFRAVHDYQGHAQQGHKFGATGEERAYLEHKKTLGKEAQKALASETRGQNSWVNYGPLGEANRANPSATTYSEQKAGLLPDWATKDIEQIASPVKYGAKKAGLMAVRAGLPALAIGAASSDNSVDEALMNTIIPGGAEALGDPLEDRMIMEEVKARQNYDNSQAGMAAEARRQALQKLGK